MFYVYLYFSFLCLFKDEPGIMKDSEYFVYEGSLDDESDKKKLFGFIKKENPKDEFLHVKLCNDTAGKQTA